ncbi:16S rRNA (cytidine(1402)-2'-O)-methyltransferase [Alphaproteobacteria bacterium]|nr:16S rRNA (cytidine(1402)-2'-O)-methyltransferase [Alphaproteobacteria bacterium]
MRKADIQTNGLPAGLYIVATPLGNSRDITLRALDILSDVSVIYCEDTRTSGKLMTMHNITTSRRPYHEHNAAEMRPKILRQLEEGQAIALISDAGTPLISDPGMPLVRAARDAGFEVFAVPGASAPIAALSIAGLATDQFTFFGFLPPKQAARQKALEKLAPYAGTLVFFENAKRVAKTLADVAQILGEREVVVAREITKKFEQVIAGTAAELAAQFDAEPPRGELVFLVGPAANVPVDEATLNAQLDASLQTALETMSLRDAVKHVTEQSGQKRKIVYERALKVGQT